MTPKPVPLTLASDQLAAIARATHGLDVRTAQPLGGEYAANARLETPQGARMCKVFAVPAAEAEELAEQQRWRGGLANRLAQAGLPVAGTVPAIDGGDIAVLSAETVAEGLALVVQVTEWLDGEPWSQAARDLDRAQLAALRHDLGAIAARVVAAFADAQPPSASPQHLWAFETMAAVAGSHLDRVEATLAAGDAAAARTLIGRFAALGDLSDLPRGVTHHDLHDDNLLVAPDADGQPRMSGIIDFDDACVAPLVAEVAIAAAYACRGGAGDAAASDAAAGIVDVVRGAQSVRALSSRELDVIAAGAAARLALNAAVWSARAAGGTTPEYAASRLGGTWPAIRALAALDDGELRRRLEEGERTCSPPPGGYSPSPCSTPSTSSP